MPSRWTDSLLGCSSLTARDPRAGDVGRQFIESSYFSDAAPFLSSPEDVPSLEDVPSFSRRSFRA